MSLLQETTFVASSSGWSFVNNPTLRNRKKQGVQNRPLPAPPQQQLPNGVPRIVQPLKPGFKQKKKQSQIRVRFHQIPHQPSLPNLRLNHRSIPFMAHLLIPNLLLSKMLIPKKQYSTVSVTDHIYNLKFDHFSTKT